MNTPEKGFFIIKRDTNEQNLIKTIKFSIPDQFEKLIDKAYIFAQTHYSKGQRNSGEPFIIHALNVARNCCELKMDTDSIIVAIIHQTTSSRFHTPEESEKILNEIKKEFGDDVYNLFNNVQEINSATKMFKQTDFNVLKKYVISGVDDIRPTLIKLCDILDDTQTLNYIPEEKKKGFKAKVLNVYIPIAEYFNLGEYKKELEENIFIHSDKESYDHIKQLLEKHNINDDLKNKYIDYLSTIVDILGYKAQISGRVKGVFSIYNKLKKYADEGRGKHINDIKDMLAFNVMVQTEQDCYKIAHAIIELTTNDPNNFDDYILVPKPNGYRAIHLCIQISEISVIWVEIQVQTPEMFYTNSYGPASHIVYKAALSRFVKPNDGYNWVEQIHKSFYEHINSREVHRSIPIPGRIFKDQIFVTTPKGKIIDLQNGSTAIDFAYKLHRDIGNSAIAAKVNGVTVKLSKKLNSGDEVEIIRQKGKNKQDPALLEVAISSKARKCLRSNLKD